MKTSNNADILREFRPGFKAFLVKQYQSGADMRKFMVSPKALKLILAESKIANRHHI